MRVVRSRALLRHHVVCFHNKRTASPPFLRVHLDFIRFFLLSFSGADFRRITMSISNQSSDKREAYDDGLQDLGVPMPVQTFLWSQIAPFIRPKLGKLHEAACQVSFAIDAVGCVSIEFKLISSLFEFPQFCQHAPGHHVSNGRLTQHNWGCG